MQESKEPAEGTAPAGSVKSISQSNDGDNNIDQGLTPRDLANLEKSYIPRELAIAAGIERVDNVRGAEIVGRPARYGTDYAGLIFPYRWPGDLNVREWRLRRDNPDLSQKSDGTIKEENKYLAPPGRGNKLYFPPDIPPEYLADPSIPVHITEGEKKALALHRFLREESKPGLVIGLSGVDCWKSKVGKLTTGTGARVDVKGVIPDFDRIVWRNREVMIVFDANVKTEPRVFNARYNLTRELDRRGAEVYHVDLPDVQDVNGVDDLLYVKGEDFVRAYFANNAKYATDPWDPPAAFNDYDLPTFPVESLPDFARSYVKGLAGETQTPVDLVAMQVLGVMASAVAGNIEVEARSGWREGLNLFLNTILPPANRKSAVVAAVTQPLEEVEASLIAEAIPEIAELTAERDAASERLNHLKKAAAKEKDDGKRAKQLSEIKTLSRDLAEMRIARLPKLIADDVTPEQLATLLAEQDGRMAVISAEGDIFDIMGGRYSNGAPNLGVFLKGHAGDALRVDRRGRSEIVARPALTLALSTQPDVIRGLIQKPSFRGRGLLGRFLYSLPESPLGHRKSKTEPVNPEARDQFTRRVKAMAALRKIEDGDGKPSPRMLRFSKDADDYLAAFQDELEPQLADSGELGAMADWAGKLAGAVVRLAGILHLADHSHNYSDWPGMITAETFKRAVEIGRYFIPHAQAAYAEMGADPEIESAKYILRWIERNELEFFTKREAFEGTKSRFKKVEAMEPALKLLEDQGYIRTRAQAREGGRGRRKSELFEVNPFFPGASQNSHKSQNSEKSDILPNSAICANSAKPPGVENFQDQDDQEAFTV